MAYIEKVYINLYDNDVGPNTRSVCVRKMVLVNVYICEDEDTSEKLISVYKLHSYMKRMLYKKYI